MIKQKTIFQIVKFALVGIVNTAIDLGLLNILMWITNITMGVGYSFFKAISFTAAVVNSYFMNKYWTFGAKEEKIEREFYQFFIISIGGFIINVGSATIIVSVVPNFLGLSPQLWGNVGALVGTLLGLTWNFLGYKFIVFRK